MIDWSECHLDWRGDKLLRITHIRTGTYIVPNVVLSDTAGREVYLKRLDAAVSKPAPKPKAKKASKKR